MAAFAENLHRQLMVRGSCLGVVEFEIVMTLREQDLLLVKECRPAVSCHISKSQLGS